MSEVLGAELLHPGDGEQLVSTSVFIFTSFVIVVIGYQLMANVSFGKDKKTNDHIFFNKKESTNHTSEIEGTHYGLFIKVNLATAGSWIFSFIPLVYIEPAIASAFIISAAPLITTFMIRETTTFSDIFCSIGILFSMSFLVWMTSEGSSGIGEVETQGLIIAFGACIATAVTTIYNRIYSKKLYAKGYTVPKVLAFKFILTVVFSAIYMTYEQYIGKDSWVEFIGLFTEDHLDLLKIFIVTMVILFGALAQGQGLKYTDTYTVALIVSLMPLATFTLQYFYLGIYPSLYSFLGIGLICLFVLINVVSKNKLSKS